MIGNKISNKNRLRNCTKKQQKNR